MEIEFGNRELEDLYRNLKGQEKYPRGVAAGFIKRVDFIKAAADERDLWKLRSFRFEKLKGRLGRHHAVRINDQYRLILTLMKSGGKTRVLIERIDNHDYRQ